MRKIVFLLYKIEYLPVQIIAIIYAKRILRAPTLCYPLFLYATYPQPFCQLHTLSLLLIYFYICIIDISINKHTFHPHPFYFSIAITRVTYRFTSMAQIRQIPITITITIIYDYIDIKHNTYLLRKVFPHICAVLCVLRSVVLRIIGYLFIKPHFQSCFFWLLWVSIYW